MKKTPEKLAAEIKEAARVQRFNMMKSFQVTPSSKSQQNYLERVDRNVKRMNELLAQLVEMANQDDSK